MWRMNNMQCALILNDYGYKLLHHEITCPVYNPIKQAELARLFVFPLINKTEPLHEYMYLLPIKCDYEMELVNQIVLELTNWKLEPQDYLFIRVYGINDVRIRGSFRSSFKVMLNHWLEYDAVNGVDEMEHNKWSELFDTLVRFQKEMVPVQTPSAPAWESIIQPFIYDYTQSPKYQDFVNRLKDLINNVSDYHISSTYADKLQEILEALKEIKNSRDEVAINIHEALQDVAQAATSTEESE